MIFNEFLVQYIYNLIVMKFELGQMTELYTEGKKKKTDYI